ncbi:MAG TPA: NAD-dependent epimerase/dehydratase family protein, partial [Solirubrobacterales bacterium]|nr:NAD-dependent epimerase/dehydratase family protein [Solirubrobacterales bacterium]
MGLTVAVTGPTGEVGGSLVDALEASEAVDSVRGMARRPFDPAAAGWRKASYQRGDILDRGHLAELFDGADVAVHLAFAIFGDREETRRINLEGSRNVFEAAVEAGVGRLVYASSVAAYGFHPENPQPLTEETPATGSSRFYYSAQKAELEESLDEILAGSELDAYVFRPCIVAGPRATMLIEQTVGAVRGMARRPFDPKAAGWRKATYQRGDILDRGHLAELFDGADVAVHLAIAIFGDREETRRINLEGSRNVFEAAAEAGVKRLVYASSVAAYGFHPENPQPLTEETPAIGSSRFYYSEQKA